MSSAGSVTSKTTSTLRPLKCHWCDSAFARADHLYRHERSHTKQKPFHCSICRRAFGRRDILLRHFAQVHTELEKSQVHHRQELDQRDNAPQVLHLNRVTGRRQRSSMSCVTIDDQQCSRNSNPVLGNSSDVARNTPDSWGSGLNDHIWGDSDYYTRLIPSAQECIPNHTVLVSSYEDSERARSDAASVSTYPNSEDSPDVGTVERAEEIGQFTADQENALCELNSNNNDDLDVCWESYDQILSILISEPPTNIASWASFPSSIHSNKGRIQSHGRSPNDTSGFFDRRDILSRINQMSHTIHDNLFSLSQMPAPLMPQPIVPVDEDQFLRSINVERLVEAYEIHCQALFSFIRLSNYEVKPFGEPAQRYQDPTTLPTMHKALLLSIVSIGAAYESSIELGVKLFKCTGKAIRAYLNDIHRNHDQNDPPLQLIQAMILYIAFGMSFGDKTTEDIVVGHMISLQALIQDAKLMKHVAGMQKHHEDFLAQSLDSSNLHATWSLWVLSEERKRTYFTFLWLSTASLTYFNSIPDVDLDEIELALPCDEALWEATTPECWRDMISSKTTPLFQDAIEVLLGHGRRQSEDLHGMNLPSSGGLDFFSFENKAYEFRHQTRINEGGCLVLVCALGKMIWRWHLAEGAERSAGDQTMFRPALQQWRQIWLSLMNAPRMQKQSRLLLSCLPLFDHAQLLLHVNITAAKDALRQRDYEATCSGFEKLKINPSPTTTNSSTCHDDVVELWSPISSHYQHDRKTLREAAACAAEALETAFQSGSWWTSRRDAVDLPLHSAMGIFNCVQVISTWLCQAGRHFDAEMNNKNNLRDFSNDINDTSKTLDLMRLLNEFYLRRSVQFTEEIKSASIPAIANTQGALVLAASLLQLLAVIFDRAFAWPVMTNLGKALRLRAQAIQRVH